MNRLIIQSSFVDHTVQLSIIGPQIKIYKRFPPVQFQKVNNDDDGINVNISQLGSLIITATTSISLRCKSKSTAIFSDIQIKSQDKVTISHLITSKLIVRSRSLFNCNNNQIQTLQFYYTLPKSNQTFVNQLSQKQKIFYQNQDKGVLKITNNSRLYVGFLKILKADFIIGEEAQCEISSKAIKIQLMKSDLIIRPRGKLYGIGNLLLFSQNLMNYGYISTRDYQNGLILIQCKKIENKGHIKLSNLQIVAKQLLCNEHSEIQSKNGSINADHIFQNQGKIQSPGINIGFKDSETYKSFNKGNIITKNMQIKAQYFNNAGLISAQSINVIGKVKTNVFKNEGSIFTKKLSITDAIFTITQNGKIISQKQIHLKIKGYINDGINTTNNSLIQSSGIIYNTGVLKFNQNVLLSTKNLTNNNRIESDKGSIKIDKIFINKGQFSAKQIEIITKSVNNLGTIDISKLYLKAQEFINSNTFKGDSAFIKANYIDNNGNWQIKNNHITTKNLNNNGQFSVDTLHFEGNRLKNQKNIQVKEQGYIQTKGGFIDKKQANSVFNNTTFLNNENNVFHTQGKVHLKNAKFQGYDIIHNETQLTLQNTDLQLNIIQVNDLVLNNAHITFQKFKTQGTIKAQGTYNGIHEKFRKRQFPNKPSQFDLDILSRQLFQSIQIITTKPTQIDININDQNLNGWTFLQHPIAVGQFHKRLNSKKFIIPGNMYQNASKNTPWKKNVKNIKNNLYQKQISVQIPNTGQSALTIETEHLLIGGAMKYQGKQLNIHTKGIDMRIGKVEVPNGILNITAEESILLVHSYLSAKNIKIDVVGSLDTQAVQMCSTLQDIFISAGRIFDMPTIIKRRKESTWRKQTTTRVWQEAHRSEFISDRNVIIKARDFIFMTSPKIQAKNNIIFDSENTIIKGIFLFDQTETIVKKKKKLGGTKTNTYISRNDKAYEAFLQANNIIFQGNAKINATFTANKVVDLTKQGLELFFIVGYHRQLQNRQFSNYATQGVEGHHSGGQKLLKANMKNVKQIQRPQGLGGKMIFNTVQWGKKKAIIKGNFQEMVYKPKSFYTSWHHQSFSGLVLGAVALVTAYFTGGYWAGMLTKAGLSGVGLSMAKAALVSLSVKAAVSFVGSGFNFGKALKSLFSVDTVKALVFDVAFAGLFDSLSNLISVQAIGTTSAMLLKHGLKFTLKTGLRVLVNGQSFKEALTSQVKNVIGDMFKQTVLGITGAAFGMSSGMDYVIHKAIHGVVGGLIGYFNTGKLEGALSGGIGAIAAEIAIEAITGGKQGLAQRAMNVIKQSNNERQFMVNVIDSYSTDGLIAKLVGGIAGAMVGGNYNQAIKGASDAIQYNFQQYIKDFFEKLKELAKDSVDHIYNKITDNGQVNIKGKGIITHDNLIKAQENEKQKQKQMIVAEYLQALNDLPPTYSLENDWAKDMSKKYPGLWTIISLFPGMNRLGGGTGINQIMPDPVSIWSVQQKLKRYQNAQNALKNFGKEPNIQSFKPDPGLVNYPIYVQGFHKQKMQNPLFFQLPKKDNVIHKI